MPSSQLIRQWTILQELSVTRRGRTLGELARAAETSPRTARRDVFDLESAGFPIEKNRDGREVRHRLPPGHPLPQVPLHLTEALALHQAALSAALFQNPAYHGHLEHALRKIRDALPKGVRDYLGRIDVAYSHRQPPGQGPDALETLRVLEEQIADRCRVRFAYESLKGEATRRTADPCRLRLHRGELYLLALCHLRGEVRVFLTDRIREIEPLEEEFKLPKGFDPETLLRSSLGIYLGEPGDAVIRFEGTAARYILQRPLHPDQTILERSDGHLVVRLPVQGHEEITQEVLRFGSRAEVLRPEELRERVRGEVERMARRYANAALPLDGGGPGWG